MAQYLARAVRRIDTQSISNIYYVANSSSGQDESNPALWLAIRAGKMELSCPLGTTRCVPQENFPRKPYNKSFIDHACKVKMAGYWLALFCEFMDLDSVSVHKHTIKELSQSLASHLVNNPYIFFNCFRRWKPKFLQILTCCYWAFIYTEAILWSFRGLIQFQ